MPEAMKYGTESFEVHLPAEQIAAEVEANHVDLPPADCGGAHPLCPGPPH